MRNIVLLLLMAIVLLSACTASANPSPSPEPEEPTEDVAVPTIEVTVEDSPEGRGSVLFHERRGDFACATCHYTSEGRLAGPGLANIASRFESYGLEGTVEDYIRTSIINPVDFIAPAEPDYPENIMPLNYSSLLTDDEISDLIAYILSL